MLAGGLYGFNWDPTRTAIFVGSIILVVIVVSAIFWYWPWNGKTSRRAVENEDDEPAITPRERPEFRRPPDEGDLL